MSDAHWSQTMLPRERIEQLENVNADLRQQLETERARMAELEGDAKGRIIFVARKQAEILELAVNEYSLQTPDGQVCRAEGLLDYAQRLRTQAAALERQSVEGGE